MRYNEFLLEYNREITLKKWANRIRERIKKDHYKLDMNSPAVARLLELGPMSILTVIQDADPTPNKQYVVWLLKQYCDGIEMEDITTRGKDALTKYIILKRQPSFPIELRDIGKFDFSKLEDVVFDYDDLLKQRRELAKGKAKKIHDSETLTVIVPEDKEAAMYYGQGTRWCTAATNNNMFDTYADNGPLFIIIPKHPSYTGEKYQFQFGSQQFMNEIDKRVDITKFIDQYPDIRNVDLIREEAKKFTRIEFYKSEQEISDIGYCIDLYLDDVKDKLQHLYFKNHRGTDNTYRSIKNNIMHRLSDNSRLIGLIIRFSSDQHRNLEILHDYIFGMIVDLLHDYGNESYDPIINDIDLYYEIQDNIVDAIFRLLANPTKLAYEEIKTSGLI